MILVHEIIYAIRVAMYISSQSKVWHVSQSSLRPGSSILFTR